LRLSRKADTVGRARVLLRGRQRTEEPRSTNPAGSSSGRNLALSVGSAGTARALTRAEIGRRSHLTHPVCRLTRARTGAIEQSRTGSRIGCRQRRHRQRTRGDRRADRGRQLRWRARRQGWHHQRIGSGQLCANDAHRSEHQRQCNQGDGFNCSHKPSVQFQKRAYHGG